MGWLSEDYQHEGWTACELPDGRLTAGVSMGGPDGGVGVRRIGTDKIESVDGRSEVELEFVDGRTAVGWRARCDCREDLMSGGTGWVGPLWRRVTNPDQADVAARLVYAEPDVYGDPPADVEELILADWQAHTRRPDADEATPDDHREDASPSAAGTGVRAERPQYGAGVFVACTCGLGDEYPKGHADSCIGSVAVEDHLRTAASMGAIGGALTHREDELVTAIALLIKDRRGERGGPNNDVDLGQLARRLIRSLAEEICGGGEQS